MAEASSESHGLRGLAALFLRLGSTAFGGPAAHIALMEDEVVRRRGWLTKEEFLDLLGATQLIPGPNSTELAIHIGYRRGGWPGLLIAGTCFIFPAACLTAAIAWGYVRFGRLPQMAAVLYGVKPVIIAVVAQALWRLGKSALKSRSLVALAVAATALSLAGLNELLILFGAGAASMAMRGGRGRESGTPFCAAPFAAAIAGAPAAGAIAPAAIGLWPLFLFFLKVGSVLFGSGYVLFAFLRADLVERWHWLTEDQLLDAIAVGQMTPGPVFTTATFIGYVLGGGAGAVLATVGIFLPAFVFVAVSGPLVPRLRRSPLAGAFLDGVIVGSMALMALVTVDLARGAVVDIVTIGLSLVSAVLLFRYRVNSAWLVLGGAAAGLASFFLSKGVGE